MCSTPFYCVNSQFIFLYFFQLFICKEQANQQGRCSQESPNSKPKKYFCCRPVNIGRTTTQDIEKRLFAYFLRFHANFRLHLGPPLTIQVGRRTTLRATSDSLVSLPSSDLTLAPSICTAGSEVALLHSDPDDLISMH